MCRYACSIHRQPKSPSVYLYKFVVEKTSIGIYTTKSFKTKTYLKRERERLPKSWCRHTWFHTQKSLCQLSSTLEYRWSNAETSWLVKTILKNTFSSDRLLNTAQCIFLQIFDSFINTQYYTWCKCNIKYQYGWKPCRKCNRTVNSEESRRYSS